MSHHLLWQEWNTTHFHNPKYKQTKQARTACTPEQYVLRARKHQQTGGNPKHGSLTSLLVCLLCCWPIVYSLPPRYYSRLHIRRCTDTDSLTTMQGSRARACKGCNIKYAIVPNRPNCEKFLLRVGLEILHRVLQWPFHSDTFTYCRADP